MKCDRVLFFLNLNFLKDQGDRKGETDESKTINGKLYREIVCHKNSKGIDSNRFEPKDFLICTFCILIYCISNT